MAQEKKVIAYAVKERKVTYAYFAMERDISYVPNVEEKERSRNNICWQLFRMWRRNKWNLFHMQSQFVLQQCM